MKIYRTYTVSSTIGAGDVYGRENAKGTLTDIRVVVEPLALDRAGFVTGEDVVILSAADYDKLTGRSE